MYLWKVDSLADDLGNDRVSQNEQFKYALLFTLLSTFFMGVAAFGAPEVPDWLRAIDMILMLVITGLGILYCYRCNQGAGNRDFILRFMCFGLPVTLRLAVLGGIAGFVWGLFQALILGDDATKQAESGVGAVVFANLGLAYVLHAAYFIYLGWCMASVEASNPAAPA